MTKKEELEDLISNLISACYITQRLFQLSDNHVLIQATQKLEKFLDNNPGDGKEAV